MEYPVRDCHQSLDILCSKTKKTLERLRYYIYQSQQDIISSWYKHTFVAYCNIYVINTWKLLDEMIALLPDN